MWKIFVMLHFYCRYFTVTFTVAVAVLLSKTHCFFFTTCFEFSCSLFTFESLHNGGTLYYVIFPYYRGTVYSL